MSAHPPIADPPIHRVVQADGRRYSLKLEQAYWKILEEEAKREGLPLARLVQRVALGVPADASLTGVLRLYCVELLRERASTVPSRSDSCAHSASPSESPSQLALRRLMSFFVTCPAAGLLLNPHEKVICANRAFETWSRLRGDYLVGKAVDWHFQLRMAEPIGAVMARFAKGVPESLTARISYISPGRIVVANAAVSLVLWTASDDFVWSVMIDSAQPGRPAAAEAVAGSKHTPG
ncbi:MAG: ribbon-helix-helix domain-containing protein [Alphaproteobacteria bacterium]